jgi:hypothetical protein
MAGGDHQCLKSTGKHCSDLLLCREFEESMTLLGHLPIQVKECYVVSACDRKEQSSDSSFFVTSFPQVLRICEMFNIFSICKTE